METWPRLDHSYLFFQSWNWTRISRSSSNTSMNKRHAIYKRGMDFCHRSTMQKAEKWSSEDARSRILKESETPILWPPDAKSCLIWKDPDTGKDQVQEEKGTTEDEMVGWHRLLDGLGFWWTQGVGDQQGDLACCSSWGLKESDTTVRLNWTDDRFRWTAKVYLTFLF